MAKVRKNEFETFARRKPELTVLTDHPLTDKQTKEFFDLDPFNFRFKLGPVYDILRHPDTKTPTAILISGGWGTGKTSAMKWLHALLGEWNKQKPSNVPNKEYLKVRPIWFYPWKYDNKEDVRRGLIAEVIIKSIDVENVSTRTVISAAKKFGLFLGKSFIHALASIKLKGSISADVGATKAEAGADVDLASIKEILSEYQHAAHPEKAYLNEFETTLRDWVKDTVGRYGKERMVIFIDDLDRCMPDIALQVLEALKLYLNIPNLIFVLGVDKQVVETLVVEYYKKLGLIKKKEDNESDLEKDKRKKAETKAKQYLSKMFQVEIEISPSEEQISDFFDKQLKEIPYWKMNLPDKDHQRLFRGLVLKMAGRNPREVKRILNSALMSGIGIQKIKLEKGKKKPKFEQGLQDFFIRQILQRPYYERVSGMIDMDQGRKFLEAWSKFVLEKKSKEPDLLKEMLPNYITK